MQTKVYTVSDYVCLFKKGFRFIIPDAQKFVCRDEMELMIRGAMNLGYEPLAAGMECAFGGYREHFKPERN